ncbi:MAG: hypothetical protein HYS41_05185 [Candidatus Omnitrophica bacterium]|nr:hypothetical protein [Candidatus Omnitrophota bacterium]
MFWLTLTLGILMGLISRALIRRFIQKSFPGITDGHLDVLLIILLLIVAALSVTKHRDEEAKRMILRDVERKTQEVERLPDGRSRFGVVITGKPIVILEEHGKAISKFNIGDFGGCLQHSQRAIQAHEETLETLSRIANYGVDGGAYLPARETAKLYDLAARCADRLGKGELAAQYREKAKQ